MRNADNPQELIVLLGWRDLESVKAFADSVHLQTTMARMGAVGVPEVYVLQWRTGGH